MELPLMTEPLSWQFHIEALVTGAVRGWRKRMENLSRRQTSRFPHSMS
jgi:hypothetical protein